MVNKFFMYKYQAGDIVTLKKKHPCGSNNWQVVRAGQKIELACLGCGHKNEMHRETLEKATVQVKNQDT